MACCDTRSNGTGGQVRGWVSVPGPEGKEVFLTQAAEVHCINNSVALSDYVGVCSGGQGHWGPQ